MEPVDKILENKVDPDGIHRNKVDPDEIIGNKVGPNERFDNKVDTSEVVDNKVDPDGIHRNKVDPDEIIGNKVEPIEKCYNKNEVYPSVIDRYYAKRYSLDIGHKSGDYCILFHSNRICVVTLAPSHPIRRLGKTVQNLDFQISTSVDRLDNRVSGKSKRGAQRLDVNSALCFARCSDGEVYKICAGIPGKLVEINENLPENPNLLVECPETRGFVAIVLPSIPTSERFKEELMTYEQYLEAVSKRDVKVESGQ